MSYIIDFANHPIKYAFRNPSTRRFFGLYLNECEGTGFDIKVSREYMEENRWLVGEDSEDDFLEFQALMLATGNELLTHRRALFHGVALIWKQKAWIFTAPSGTGKTTQYRLWKKILKKEIQVINGDKPLLHCHDDGSIWVHSSPWRGKERVGVIGRCAPLGGIIYLEQGDHNTIRRLKPNEAARPLFVAFISYPDTTEQIEGQAEILNQMLDAVPVWKLTNLGDEASAILTQNIIKKYLREDE